MDRTVPSANLRSKYGYPDVQWLFCLASVWRAFVLAALLLPGASASRAQMQLLPGITSVAGNGTGAYAGDGGLATSAEFNLPTDVAFDSAGNWYIADYSNCRIRKVTLSTGDVSTVAGNGTCGYSGDGGAATGAELNGPNSVAIDISGNIYIADHTNNCVREVTVATGTISTVAGTGTAGYSGDGAAATSANLYAPVGVALDSSGNIYIGDRHNNRVRKVTISTGYISTVAGNGTAGYSGDGGAATSAELNGPDSVAIDSSGNIYISDSGDSRIRRVTISTGNISTVAGNGIAGYSGDGGAATSAEINGPNGVAVDSSGNIYISDSGNYRIRQVNAGTGKIRTLAGNGTAGDTGNNGPATNAEFDPNEIGLDSLGNVYIADSTDNVIRKVQLNFTFPTTALGSSSAAQDFFLETTAAETLTSITAQQSQGSKQEYSIGTITGCTVNGSTSNPNGTICTVPVTFAPAYPGARKVALTAVTGTGTVTFPLTGTGTGPLVSLTPGVISTIAGNGTAGYAGDGAAATGAELSGPYWVAVDSAGNVYVADTGNNRIRKITASTGYISTVAGNGTAGYSGDGGAATSAELNAPRGVTVDGAGNIYISDYSNDRIREVNTATGVISTLIGNAGYGYSGDGGLASNAKMEFPWGIALDSANNIYFNDWVSQRVRKITASTGIITTIAGNGTAGYSGDGGTATSAELNFPAGVAVDTSGNVYIGDWGNHRVRLVNASTGVIDTVAGNGTPSYSGDGGAATSAELTDPAGIAFDSAGNYYIGDEYNNRIRTVNLASGDIVTVAGNGTQAYAGDGGGATSATLNQPIGVALDSAGNLYIADNTNNVIRKVNVSQSQLRYQTSTAVGTMDGADDPQTTTVANIGNASLSVSVPSSGNNPSVSAYFELDNSTTCPELATSSSAETLASGSNCTYALDFAPTIAGAVSGSVVVTDNSLGGAAATQSISLTATATKGTPPISWPNPAPITFGTALSSTQLDASSSLSGTFVYSPTSGTVLSAGSQTLSVTFNPTDTTDYNSGTDNVTLTVNPAAPTITFTVSNQTYGVSPFTVSASSNSAGAITYLVVSGPATISGSTVTITGIGTVVLQAAQAANGNYTSGTQNASFTVSAAAPTITFTVSNQAYGVSPFTVSASSNSVGAFTYSVLSGPATISGSTVTLSGVGAVVLQAAQAANGNYTAGTQNASFSVVSTPFSLLPQTINAFAGVSGTASYTGDGGLATAATFSSPSSVAMDQAGNLYVADSNNNVVRKITPAGYISTFAGTGTAGKTGDGGAATSAELYHPKGLAFDSSGNLYIADNKNSAVRKVTPAGVISLYAGSYVSSYSGDGGAATSATLSSPYGLAMDSSSNLYICDTSNNVIRKVTSSGTISTFAGNHTAGYSGDAGAATSAMLNAPKGVAVDSGGNVYIADTTNNRVRMVNTSGTISSFAGDGVATDSGDGAAATSAGIYDPQNLTVDSGGNLYIGEPTRLRWVSTGGIIQTIAGTGTSGSTGNGGAATSAEVGTITGVILDPLGQLYLSDNAYDVIRRVTLNATFPATAVGQSSAAQTLQIAIDVAFAIQSISLPSGYSDFSLGSVGGCTVNGSTVNAAGTVCTLPVTFSPQYAGLRSAPLTVTDGSGIKHAVGLRGTGSGAVLGFQPGIISTFAGTGASGHSGDGGQATAAQLNLPHSAAAGADGSVYIADYNNSTIRKVSAAGVISTVVGIPGVSGSSGDGGAATSAKLNAPRGVATDIAGNLYIADAGNHRIRKVDPNGNISTIAGTGASTGSCPISGLATATALYTPDSLAFDSNGNLYFTDGDLQCVGVIYTSGYIATFAGTGTSGHSGDGGQATLAHLTYPNSVAVDSSNNVYIADSGNNRIRMVTPQGIISTVAGNGTAGYTGDAGSATAAELNSPDAVALDAANNLYIADNGNQVVRQINGAGIISTVAGNGTAGYSGDGGAATLAKLYLRNTTAGANNVYGIAIGSSGNLLLPDTNNNVIRSVNTQQTAPLTFSATNDDSAIGPDLVAINSGGPQTGSFAADEDFLGGQTYSNANSITTAGVANAAPAAVYQSERSGGFSYTIPGLTAGTSYLVRLHFAEIYWTQVGQRIFNVAINGTPVLSNFDIVAAAGGPNIAVVEQFIATANGSGQIVVGFTAGSVDLPKISGVEIATISSSAASAAQSVTVLNEGNANLVFSSLTASTGYQIVGATCSSGSLVTSGQTCTVGVVFAPTGGTGTQTGTATLTDNAPSSPHTIGLTGSSALQASSCALAANPSPASYGASVTLTATVSPASSGSPTGSVTLLDGTTTLGTATLSGSVATLAVSTLTVGTHSLTFTYPGDTAFSGCTSSLVSETITRSAVNIALNSSPNPSYYGDAVTLSLNFSGASAAIPTGTATLKDGSTTLTTLTLDANGNATYTAQDLIAGSHVFKVSYNGDGNYF